MRHTVSLVISFYNESKNIKSLTEIVKKIKSKNDNLIEVIFVDNASIDDTPKVLREICKLNNYIFLSNDKSEGYGNGYFAGINKAKGDFILINHSDLQFSFDIFDDFNRAIENNKNIACFVKRTGRSFVSSFKTLIARFFCMIIFLHYVPEVNGQPKIFPKKIFNNIYKHPSGYSFDLFIYKLLRKNNIKIKRFNNRELPRLEGVSSWSKSFSSQLSNLLKYLKEAIYINKIIN